MNALWKAEFLRLSSVQLEALRRRREQKKNARLWEALAETLPFSQEADDDEGEDANRIQTDFADPAGIFPVAPALVDTLMNRTKRGGVVSASKDMRLNRAARMWIPDPG